MPASQIILGILLMVISIAAVAIVLAQPGKDKRLSGAIAGGSETYFGKGKTARFDKTLNTITVVLCVALFVAVLVLYCLTAGTTIAAPTT